MGKPLRVLLIEDSDFDAELLLALLNRGGYSVEHHRVETAEELKKTLKEPWDIVIADSAAAAAPVEETIEPPPLDVLEPAEPLLAAEPPAHDAPGLEFDALPEPIGSDLAVADAPPAPPRDEIPGWLDMTPQTRREIMGLLPARLETMERRPRRETRRARIARERGSVA
jgi:hypothetical protein